MEKLFQYNWQVRDDWFSWCEDLSEKDLLKRRVGGVGSILYTLFHIVDVEYSWIHFLQTKQDPGEPLFDNFNSLEKLKDLSNQYRKEVEPYVMSWKKDMDTQIIKDTRPDGKITTFRYGEIMRHVIAHEIHHIGQLSIWSRELEREPVTANLILRGLYK